VTEEGRREQVGDQEGEGAREGGGVTEEERRGKEL
jgi:hypothetical protein